MPRLEPQWATEVTAQILEALGTPQDIASKVAGWLVAADLSGHPSHGMIRVHDYATRIRRGELVPEGRPRTIRDTGQMVLVDGRHGYGHLAASRLTLELAKKARTGAVAVGGIVNASHTGRLGEWAELAVEQGVVLFMCYASTDKSNVAGFGAREGRLGTNPMAIGVPADGGDSLVLDFATSAIAGGKVDHLLQTGGAAPAGSLLDKDGAPTTDPATWKDGGMLLTFGGHKGYGLSLLVSVLSGCVVGQSGDEKNNGVLALAIDPGTFATRDEVLASVRTQLDRMRTTPPAPGFEHVEVPGDYERRNRRRHGGAVGVPDATWESILSLGESLGLSRSDLARTRPS